MDGAQGPPLTDLTSYCKYSRISTNESSTIFLPRQAWVAVMRYDAPRFQHRIGRGQMFRDLFNPRKRAASHEFEVALHYLLHDAKAIVPMLKKTYKNEWSGLIDDILNGARPYEEATVVIGLFLRQSLEGLDQHERNKIAASISNNNASNPPNLLRIAAQVTYLLHLAERDNYVRENCWSIWVNDMAKMLADGSLSQERCGQYILLLAKKYRDAKHTEHVAGQR